MHRSRTRPAHAHALAAITAVGLALALMLTAPQPAAAQTAGNAESPVVVRTPAADPADVASIDAIIAALYDVISGPAGQARDWDRMRSLFIPGGRLMPTGPRQPEGVGTRIMGVNDFIALSGPSLERVGFTEREIARRADRFGNIAHVFSTYHGTSERESVEVRGINSIQLLHDGDRWWIVSVYWQAEGPDNPLPAEYLPNR